MESSEGESGASGVLSRDRVLQALRDRFGFDTFRDGQEDVILSIVGGMDTVAVMPTGAGKSLCYQLPALLLDGVTLVVSPLIALMKDQVDALDAKGIPSTFVNSTLTLAEQDARLRKLEQGVYRICYVAPERFRSQRFFDLLRHTRIALFAVDEAHCISQWGHDFRPDYSRLGAAAHRLGRPPISTFTATATHGVIQDIAKGLELKAPRYFIGGFDRPNLFIECQQVRAKDDKIEPILRLAQQDRSGIVYAATRRSVEWFEAALNRRGLRCGAYHAGLADDQRHRIQDAFMSGEIDVVVATNAFGMGIDKADIRFVVHAEIPRSLEAYYQEIGRAGRDGKPSTCLLLFQRDDTKVQRFFIENSYPERWVIEGVLEALVREGINPATLSNRQLAERLGEDVSDMAISSSLKILEESSLIQRLYGEGRTQILVQSGIEPRDLKQAPVQKNVISLLLEASGGRGGIWLNLDARDLASRSGLDQESIRRALRALQKEGKVDYLPASRGRMVRILPPKVRGERPEIDDQNLKSRRLAEMKKLALMVTFAIDGACRRHTILEYFTGEAPEGSCGHCDSCRDRHKSAVEEAEGAALIVVQKILSAVARTRGRFGKHRVVQVLRGSKSKDMADWLTELSVYGTLAHLTAFKVTEVLDELISLGAVTQSHGRYPCVSLSDYGYEVVHGRDSVRLESLRGFREVQPRRKLREALGELRDTWAREQNVSHDKVLSNRALEEISRRKPRHEEAFSAIPGIGPEEVQRYWGGVRDLIDRETRRRLVQAGNEESAAES